MIFYSTFPLYLWLRCCSSEGRQVVSPILLLVQLAGAVQSLSWVQDPHHQPLFHQRTNLQYQQIRWKIWLLCQDWCWNCCYLSRHRWYLIIEGSRAFGLHREDAADNVEDCIVVNFWDMHVIAHLHLLAHTINALAADDDTLTLPLLPIVWPYVLDNPGRVKEHCKRSTNCSNTTLLLQYHGGSFCGDGGGLWYVATWFRGRKNWRWEERCSFCLNCWLLSYYWIESIRHRKFMTAWYEYGESRGRINWFKRKSKSDTSPYASGHFVYDQTRTSTFVSRDNICMVSCNMTRHVRAQLCRVAIRIWSVEKKTDMYEHTYVV